MLPLRCLMGLNGWASNVCNGWNADVGAASHKRHTQAEEHGICILGVLRGRIGIMLMLMRNKRKVTRRTFSKLLTVFLAMAPGAACSQDASSSDIELVGVVKPTASGHADGLDVFIPGTRKYADQLQVRLTLPSPYIYNRDEAEGERGLIFKPLAFGTMQPNQGANEASKGVVTYNLSGYLYEIGDIPQLNERFQDTGLKRFGLSYRPDPVPSRPEELWKRVYMKPGVSGEDFLITCIPPIGPGSIIPPITCTMTFLVAQQEVFSMYGGSQQLRPRRAGVQIRVNLAVEDLENWQEIEQALRKLLLPKLTLHSAENTAASQ